LKGEKLIKFDPDQAELKLSGTNRRSSDHKNQPELTFKDIKSNSIEPKKRADRKKSPENNDNTIKKFKDVKNQV
jgi:hypothetical protein